MIRAAITQVHAVVVPDGWECSVVYADASGSTAKGASFDGAVANAMRARPHPIKNPPKDGGAA